MCACAVGVHMVRVPFDVVNSHLSIVHEGCLISLMEAQVGSRWSQGVVCGRQYTCQRLYGHADLHKCLLACAQNVGFRV